VIAAQLGRQAVDKMQSLIDRIAAMAGMTIRNLDDRVKTRLRVRAAEHGRSMEDEAREILTSVLAKEPARAGNIYDAIRDRFARLGGVELHVREREPIRPVDLG
jgi:plasmid stability protein